MGRPLSCSIILAAALLAIGCSERETAPPTAPDFHTGLTLSSGCDFQHLGQLANSFLQPPVQQTAKAKVDTMAAAGAYSFIAKDRGFDIMALMEGAVNNGTAGDASVGSNLMNHLLLCMYNPTTELASYPASFPDTFNVALTVTASAHGGFGHRSGTSTSPVYSRPINAPFTGVAPPQIGTPPNTSVLTWGTVISPPSTSDPARVVFYGRPATGTGATNQTYDWRAIPRNMSFNPYIIVGICIDPFTTANNTTMLNAQSQQSVAILGFEDAYFLTPGTSAGSCSQDLSLLEVNSPLLFARRMLRFGTRLFTPRPLNAAVTTLLSPGGLGGRTSKGGTKYGPRVVPSVSATLSNVKSRIQANTERFELTATAKFGSDPVNGTKFTLSTTVNSGTNTFVRVAPPNTPCSQGVQPVGITGTGTNSAGTYLFTNLCFTNTGNVYIVGTANVEDRGDTPVTVKSNKIISYP